MTSPKNEVRAESEGCQPGTEDTDSTNEQKGFRSPDLPATIDLEDAKERDTSKASGEGLEQKK